MATFTPVEAVEEEDDVGTTDGIKSFVPVEEVTDAAVEQSNVPRGTPPRRRSAAGQLAETLQANNLFGSATTALEGAWDKGIRRKDDGDWDLPLMNQTGDSDVLNAIGGTATSAGQKLGARLDSAGPAIDQKAVQGVFHKFQQDNNLSDEEVTSAWSDLGNLNRSWGDKETSRVLSDGTLLPNAGNSDWLDAGKAASLIEASSASPESKAATLRRLPEIQAAIASDKIGAYEAAATASNAGRPLATVASLGGLQPERFVPPSEWAEANNRDDIGSPQFILDYEASVNPGFLQGLAGKVITGGNKLNTTILGIAGALGSDSAGELAAELSEGSAAVNRGLPATGLAGSIVEEAPSVVAQMLTGRLLGVAGKSASTLGTFGAAGLQSAGLTYADEIADGTPEEEAREKAAKAGVSTALITSMFGTGTAGGVERVAVGNPAGMTVRELIDVAREKGAGNLMKSPDLRDFAKEVLQAAGGEAAEEGIDQLVGRFLTADPDENLADAWASAVEAGTIGGAIGGTVDVTSRLNSPEGQMVLDAQVDSPVAAAEALKDITGETNDEPETAPPVAAETAPAGQGLERDELPDTPGTLEPPVVDETTLPEQPADPTEALPPPAGVVESPVESEQDVTGGKGLDKIGSAGRAMVDNFYDGIESSIVGTGEVPSAERGTRVGKAWGMVRDYPGNLAEKAKTFTNAVRRAAAEGDTAESWAKAITEAFPANSQPFVPVETVTGVVESPVAPEQKAIREEEEDFVRSRKAARTAERRTQQASSEVGRKLNKIETKWESEGVEVVPLMKPDSIEITVVRVPKERRGGGIGSKVLADFKALSNESGLPVTLLAEDLDATGTSPGAFYEKNGFTPLGNDRFQYDPVPTADFAYTRDRLRDTFNLTEEQADATDALVQSMGLDTSRIDLRNDRESIPRGYKLNADGSVTANGIPIKGLTQFVEEGRAVVRGLTNPDISTALHELSHVARRTLFDRELPVAGITPEDIEVAEMWAGAKNGRWDVKAEEKFARGFEKYLREGEAPTPQLASVFQKIANWLQGIYQSIKGSPLDLQVTPAMRRVFDTLVTRNVPAETQDSGTTGETSQPVGEDADLTEENEQATLPPAPAAEPQESPENLTSVKNEATDSELAKYGFDPIAAPAQRTLQESWDAALARFERNSAAGINLVTELNTKPRATDDVEHGVLLKELADAKVAYGAAQQRLSEIEASGKTDELEQARREAGQARDRVYNTITAAKATGTVWGRAGRFRQLAIDDDYSLVQMEASFRTEVNDGKPLTPDQAAEVKGLHDEIAKAKQELEDYKAKAAEEVARKVHEATLAMLRKAKPKLRKALGSKIEEAKKKLRDAGLISPDAEPDFLAQEGLPEDILDAFATIAAGWQIDSDLSPEEFESRLRKLGGDAAATHVDAIRQRSREIIDASIDETFRDMEDASADAGPTTRSRKPKTIEAAMEGIDPADGPTGNDIFQIARIHIRNGVEGFENVMTATLETLNETFPDLTLRELHDLYSGYGRAIFPSKDADLTKLREYRTLARLTSQLEDATRGDVPKRTGMQRDKTSEKVRTLQKQVAEMMRKLGVSQVSDDQRLKSSLDAVKTRLKNEIEELEASIRDRQPRPSNRSQVEYDAEAKVLKDQRDKLREEYTAIFGKKEATDEERIRATVRALERRIEETEKLIAAGKPRRDRAARNPVSSPGIDALRAKLGGLNEQRNALRDREKERLERTKKVTQNRIEKIRKRVATDDYAPATKLPPVKPDTELGRLQKMEIDLKREFNTRLLDANLAKRSKGAKVYDAAVEIANASRSIITSADVSAVLRQGGFIALGNPKRALRAIIPMFRAGLSSDYAQALADNIEKNDYFVQSQRAKLFLSEFGDTHHFSKQEEAFRGRLAKEIPYYGKVVEFSERTYTAFLNKLRMDTFEAMAKSVSPTGDLTDSEAKVIANFINVATGRGNLERFDRASEALAAAFFSPKYVVSRFQLLAQPMTGFGRLKGASPRVSKAVAREYGKTLIGATVIYSMVAIAKMMLGDDEDEITVEHDPRSSDFGKIRIGDTRIDPLFGLSQATVLISRLATGETKGADGNVVPIRGDDATFGKSPATTLGRFLRTKLAPVPSTVINFIDGEDVVGNKVFWETELTGNLLPLSMGDIYSTVQEQGLPKGSALAILALFGAGVTTYGDDDRPPMEQDIMTTFFGVDPERYED